MQGENFRPHEANKTCHASAHPGGLLFRLPPALPSRLHTDSGLHPCHQFSGSIRGASAFGGFYFGG
jgi:hypothetical protein